MPEIFLSYAHADGSDAASRLRAELERADFSVWRDIEDMRGGTEWKAQLRAVLRKVDVVLVLLTPQAMQSRYVTWEWETALTLEKYVIPLLISPCNVPDDLARLHYHDLSQPNAESYSMGLAALIRDLRIDNQPKSSTEQATGGIPDAVTYAKDALNSHISEERAIAIDTLKQTDHPAAVEALVWALQHPIRDVREKAATALGERRDSIAVPALLKALSDNDGQVRQNAVVALGKIGDPSAVVRLVEVALTDHYMRIPIEAARALVKIGREALPGLIEVIKRTSSPPVRQIAVEGLGEMKSDLAVPILVKLLSDETIVDNDPAAVLEKRSRICDIAANILNRIGTSESQKAVRRWQQKQTGNA